MKVKKLIAGITSAVMMSSLNVLAGGGHTSLIAEAEESVPSGYTAIHNIEELYAVRNDLDGKYILMNDIDMTEDTAPGGDWDINGTGWEPIGTYNDNKSDWYGGSEPFNGIFEGNGHAIKGMNFHGDVGYKAIGLFGCCGNRSQIKNLKVIDCNISSDCENIGTILGRGIYYDSSGEEGVISGCFTSGNINIINNSYTGGIVGYLYENNIINCYNAVDIHVENSEKYEDYYVPGGYVGGISGYVYYQSISYCYNIGNITTITNSDVNVGAIAGNYDTEAGSSMEKCYYLLGTCEDQVRKSGIRALSDVQIRSQASYTNWDFDNTWIILKNSNYKYPQLRSCMQIPLTEMKLIFAPEKKTYYSGDKINLMGGKLRVKFEDGLQYELDMEENMLGKYNMRDVGKQSITVTYLNKTVTFDIEINKILYGDANLDGTVNIRDAAFIARKAAQGKISELSKSSDYNNDGIINIRDAAFIARDMATNKI